MHEVFVDREQELGVLEDLWSKEEPGLVVVYGRRRIGKTALLKRFMEGKPSVYLLAEELSEAALARSFSLAVADTLGLDYFKLSPARRIADLLRGVAAALGDRRAVVIIDEFQYAARSGEGVLSSLQAVWDEVLSKSRILLVLCGSAVSFTAWSVLSEKAPLYGRASAVIKVDELSPLYIPAFARGWGAEDHVRLYAVFGGVPGYLARVDPETSLRENLISLVLRKGSPFYDEAKLILREEVRDVGRYYSILEAVSGGATRFSEIASRSGVPRESLTKYIYTLMDLGLIEKAAPVVGKGKPVYRVKDHLLRFWFKYVLRFKPALELGMHERVAGHVVRDMESSLVPEAWEEVVAHMLAYMVKSGMIGITPTRIGRWWHKGEEIDILMIDDTSGKTLAAEAKWSSLTTREALRIAYSLEAKVKHIPLKPEHITIAVAAKNISEPERLEEEGYLPITLDTYKRISGKLISQHSTHYSQ